jgi:hypothetical protein
MTEATVILEFNKLVREKLGKPNQNSPTKQHVCPTCFKQYDYSWQLERHLGDAHKQKVVR